MNQIHLVRLPLFIPAFHRWAAERGFGWSNHKGMVFDEGCALHHLLVETFGRNTLKPFRLFVAPKATNGNLYAYSSADSQILRATAQETSLPETLKICDFSRLDSKAMPEQWREGRRIGFDIKIRPVRRLAKNCGPFGKGAEVDAFLVEALRNYPDDSEAEACMHKAGRTREKVYAEWLAERLGSAANLETAKLTSFARLRSNRKSHVSEGPDAVLQGELTVCDSNALSNRLLIKGIGRHTAYGYGMLLLRPAGKR